jgi:hypothetical protein
MREIWTNVIPSDHVVCGLVMLLHPLILRAVDHPEPTEATVALEWIFGFGAENLLNVLSDCFGALKFPCAPGWVI